MPLTATHCNTLQHTAGPTFGTSRSLFEIRDHGIQEAEMVPLDAYDVATLTKCTGTPFRKCTISFIGIVHSEISSDLTFHSCAPLMCQLLQTTQTTSRSII